MLPRVWARLVGDADDPHGERLYELVSEAVEAEADSRPSREVVRAFLAGRRVTEHEPQDRPFRRAVGTPGRPPGPPQRTKAPARRIEAFELDGTRHAVATWREMLADVCELLIAEAGADFADRVARLAWRRHPRFGGSPEPYQRAHRLSNGLYMDVNLSAVNAERHARDVLRAVRRSDVGFAIIERTG